MVPPQGTSPPLDRSLGRYRGCILGLAIGDALGAPIEFLTLTDIRARYGPNGITDLEAWRGHQAGSFTDDTQMSVATAIGLLSAFEDEARRGASHVVGSLYGTYGAWLELQVDEREQRGPGRTCITALASGRIGTVTQPLNDSKGCGGVMRVAPIGLAFPAEVAFRYGADAAAITHGHPSGYLSAGLLAEIVARLADGEDLHAAADAACNSLGAWEGHRETLEAVHRAATLAAGPTPTHEAVAALGAGWVGEEALGIALFCAMRFGADFRSAVCAAANHDGDSDSTASICGAIVGTAHGVEALPKSWVERVERRALLEDLARRMHEAFVRGSSPPV
jgi:ADP-ribosylglycohydrolase